MQRETRKVRRKNKTAKDIVICNRSWKKSVKTKDGKVLAACFVRDLFGSLLTLSMEKKINMDEVMTYPLTPVPLSLCHVDGTMVKSLKSALLHHLESKVLTSDPSSVYITIIHVTCFMHLHINLPTTLDGVARYLLSQIMRFDGKIVPFVVINGSHHQ